MYFSCFLVGVGGERCTFFKLWRILYKPGDDGIDAIVSCTLSFLYKHLQPLVTHELPQNNEIKLLDLRIRFSDEVR